jgi:methylated-DNA-protein-cysteine methyltransferase-like protein
MSELSNEARILAAVRRIPEGEVCSYGEVARRAGLPRRARLVARILAGNTDPTLPWHRVLRADGRIALPIDSAGYREQYQRLQGEGVTLKHGRVQAVDNDIDALLWGPAHSRAK